MEVWANVALQMLLLGLVVIGLAFFWALMDHAAPFVPTPLKRTERIAEVLQLHSGAVFYDLGCGDGRILQAALARGVPGAMAVGVDRHRVPLLLAKWRLRHCKNVRLRRADILQTSLHEANYIFCYLYPGLMEKLEGKFARELQAGAVLFSLDFPLPHKEPSEKITVGMRGLGQTLYIYSF